MSWFDDLLLGPNYHQRMREQAARSNLERDKRFEGLRRRLEEARPRIEREIAERKQRIAERKANLTQNELDAAKIYWSDQCSQCFPDYRIPTNITVDDQKKIWHSLKKKTDEDNEVGLIPPHIWQALYQHMREIEPLTIWDKLGRLPSADHTSGE